MGLDRVIDPGAELWALLPPINSFLRDAHSLGNLADTFSFGDQ